VSRPITRIGLLLVMCLSIVLLVACSGGAQGPSVTIEDVWAPQSPAPEGTGAVYMTLKNSGNEADTLVKVTTKVSDAAEIHEMSMENQVMKMRPVSGQRLEIPARDAVELKPGGLHIMLIGLKQQLKPGDKIDLTLTFEKSGEKTVQAEVRAIEGMENMKGM